MKKYFLDTSVIIEFLRGNEEWTRKLADLDGEVASSFVCLAELYEGIARDTRNNSEAKILGFFKSFSKVYTVDGKVAQYFGRLRAELKKTGNVIEDMDIMVASTCLAMGLTLLTLNNKHFERIPGLQIYTD